MLPTKPDNYERRNGNFCKPVRGGHPGSNAGTSATLVAALGTAGLRQRVNLHQGDARVPAGPGHFGRVVTRGKRHEHRGVGYPGRAPGKRADAGRGRRGQRVVDPKTLVGWRSRMRNPWVPMLPGSKDPWSEWIRRAGTPLFPHRYMSLCAAVPSDHLATGTKKTISGSGMSVNSSSYKTGDPGRFAPQVAPSVFGLSLIHI